MKKYNYIYKITNLINNKQYVGKHSTDDLDDGYMGSGIVIRKAIQKYGIENFNKEYLAFCDTEEKLNWFERFYIKKYKTFETGYNLTAGGDGSLGRTCSDETKKKMSDAAVGRVLSEEWKKNISLSKIGKPIGVGHIVDEETRKKIGAANRGKIRSEEFKKRMSDSRQGENAPMYGKHHSDETKKKIAESHIGKVSPFKNKKKEKLKYIDKEGQIHYMDKEHATRYHKDWILQ